MWSELAGFDQAMKAGAHISGYIGHDEPATLFYSHQPGSGNNVTYRMRLPVDPPTRPRQNGSGGTDNLQLHPTFWLGMVMCDDQAHPTRTGLLSLATQRSPASRRATPTSFESQNPNSPRYFGLGPGQAYEEMQFYPPGWAPWPAGIGCTASQWCAALNIDTFSENENTGQLNNTACLNTVGPEPVNFAFLTKNGVATAPANPQHPEHFVPDPKRDFLMHSGDNITVLGAAGQQKHDSNPGNSLRPFHGVLLEGMQGLDAPAAVEVPSCPGPRAVPRTVSLAQDREPCPGSTAHRYAAASSNPSRARTGFLPRSTTR
jgi:hypothetical protein